jgi:hypothetical protein
VWAPWHAGRDTEAVASSVWDIWPSEHSCALWGLIVLNRCGRKLGRPLAWLNCNGGCRRHLIRLSGSGSGCRLHLI